MKRPAISKRKRYVTFKQNTLSLFHRNGPQFIAKDFKEFIRLSGMPHVRTSLQLVATEDDIPELLQAGVIVVQPIFKRKKAASPAAT